LAVRLSVYLCFDLHPIVCVSVDFLSVVLYVPSVNHFLTNMRCMGYACVS